MAKGDVISYGDKAYQQKKNLYDSVAQCLVDFKEDYANKSRGWNQPIQDMTGLTMRFIGGEHLELTYHRFVNGTYEDLARTQQDEDGKKYLKEVVKELKKIFKKKTGKALTLKTLKGKKDPSQGLDHYGRVQAETAHMVGSSRYGYGGRAVGRYLVRDSCVYELSAKAEQPYNRADESSWE